MTATFSGGRPNAWTRSFFTQRVAVTTMAARSQPCRISASIHAGSPSRNISGMWRCGRPQGS
jgi:hypothetical protein